LLPKSRQSLLYEHELSLGSGQLARLSAEAHLATGVLAASTHTAKTLVDNGISAAQIRVVPYGVDPIRYPVRTQGEGCRGPFTVAFVGRVVQRKGLSYLFEAVRRLSHVNIRVVLRGRGAVDQELLSQFRDVPIDVAVNRPTAEIVNVLHNSDLLVLPSLEEGFGHVILEAMSCGVPVVTTPRTCGPDVIVAGRHGFIVPIRDVDALASRIEWGVDHRPALVEMGIAAAARAREYTWARFRSRVVSAYSELVATPSI
jgi:glycosyltransferase involved in cell wall biosynthesis